MSLTFEWAVTSTLINGDVKYRVYRNLRSDEIDHSGNREYYSEIFLDKAVAQAQADKLNEVKR